MAERRRRGRDPDGLSQEELRRRSLDDASRRAREAVQMAEEILHRRAGAAGAAQENDNDPEQPRQHEMGQRGRFDDGRSVRIARRNHNQNNNRNNGAPPVAAAAAGRPGNANPNIRAPEQARARARQAADRLQRQVNNNDNNNGNPNNNVAAAAAPNNPRRFVFAVRVPVAAGNNGGPPNFNHPGAHLGNLGPEFDIMAANLGGLAAVPDAQRDAVRMLLEADVDHNDEVDEDEDDDNEDGNPQGNAAPPQQGQAAAAAGNNNNNARQAPQQPPQNEQQRRVEQQQRNQRQEMLQRRQMLALRLLFSDYQRSYRRALEFRSFRLKRAFVDACLRKLMIFMAGGGSSNNNSRPLDGHRTTSPPPPLQKIALHNCKFSDGAAARMGDLIQVVAPQLKQVSLVYTSSSSTHAAARAVVRRGRAQQAVRVIVNHNNNNNNNNGNDNNNNNNNGNDDNNNNNANQAPNNANANNNDANANAANEIRDAIPMELLNAVQQNVIGAIGENNNNHEQPILELMARAFAGAVGDMAQPPAPQPQPARRRQLRPQPIDVLERAAPRRQPHGQQPNPNNANNNDNNNAQPQRPQPLRQPAARPNNENPQNEANDNSNNASNANSNSANKLLTHDNAVALFTGILACHRLETINLQGLGLRNEGIVRLFTVILNQNRSTLKSLNLTQCRFNHRSMYQVAQTLAGAPAQNQWTANMLMDPTGMIPMNTVTHPEDIPMLPTLTESLAHLKPPPAALKELTLTGSEWVNDVMLRLLLRDLPIGSPGLEQLVLLENPHLTALGSLPTMTSFLARHAALRELRMQVSLIGTPIPDINAMVRNGARGSAASGNNNGGGSGNRNNAAGNNGPPQLPEDEGSVDTTAATISESQTPKRLVAKDLEDDAYVVTNFCNALHQHENLEALELGTATIRLDPTKLTSATAEPQQATMHSPPPQMAAALLQVALWTPRFRLLRLPRLLVFERCRDPKEDPMFQASTNDTHSFANGAIDPITNRNVNSQMAQPRVHPAILKSKIVNRPDQECLTYLKLFGQDPSSLSYASSKEVAIFWKNLMEKPAGVQFQSKFGNEPKLDHIWIRQHQGQLLLTPELSRVAGLSLQYLFGRNHKEAKLRLEGGIRSDFPFGNVFNSFSNENTDSSSCQFQSLELLHCEVRNFNLPISPFPALTTFSLYRSFLNAASLPLICEMLDQNPQLQRLCLSGNPNLFSLPRGQEVTRSVARILQPQGDDPADVDVGNNAPTHANNGDAHDARHDLPVQAALEASIRATLEHHSRFLEISKNHASLRSLLVLGCGLGKKRLSVDLMTVFESNTTRRLLKTDYCLLTRESDADDDETSKLRLIICFCADAILDYLVEKISLMRTLHSVQLNNWDRRNRMRFRILLPAVLSHEVGLKEFSINSINSPRRASPTFLPLLAEVLRDHPTVRSVRLSGQEPSDTNEGRLALLESLRSGIALRELSLHRMTFTSANFGEPLTRLLGHQTALEELSLPSCPMFREEGDTSPHLPLMNAIGQHPSLKRMSFRDCIWSASPMLNFFQALVENDSKLEMLDIGHGGLDQKIGEWIEYLPRLKHLWYLKIPRDLWVDERWQCLVDRLKRNTSICRIQHDRTRIIMLNNDLREMESIWSGAEVSDESIIQVTQRNTMLFHSKRMVNGGGVGQPQNHQLATTLAPLILEKFGSFGNTTDGTAVFHFLRTVFCGEWNGHGARKRDRSLEEDCKMPEQIVEEDGSETGAPSRKRRKTTQEYCKPDTPSGAHSRVDLVDEVAVAAAIGDAMALEPADNTTAGNPGIGTPVLTLENVRREIWLNYGGSVRVGPLLRTFDIKKSSPTTKQQLFKEITRKLCTLKRANVTPRQPILILKQQYCRPTK